MNFYALTHCLCCNSDELILTLDLGHQPLANDFRPPYSLEPETFPLALNTCKKCWHSQLSHCVSRELIFSNYTYASGTSTTLAHYFKWFAENLKKFLPRGARVLDIAANDGSFVAALKEAGFEGIGIDPASNLVASAKSKGISVIEGYWPQDADKLSGRFDAIVCMNVLAHVDNPFEFLNNCTEFLNPGGVILVQPSQARMFGNNEFDTCYHEHLSFFNTHSISVLGEAAGLKLNAAFFTKIHGDSCVYVFSAENKLLNYDINYYFSKGKFGISEDVLDYENSIGLYSRETYTRFSEKSNQRIAALRGSIDEYRRNNYKIIFVGAAAKAMTVINYAKIKPDLFLDEASLKIGRVAPGAGVLIDDLSAIQGLKSPAFVVITAWNFKDELLRKLINLGIPRNSVYYCYFPVEELKKFDDIIQ